MELQQLRYFAAVTRTGNFTRAAELCGVSQPTLSQQIGKLERELGQPLFERLPGGAALTDAGRAFAARIGPALEMLDAARQSVRADAAAGRLTVAAIPTVAPFLLPAAIAKLTAVKPGARLELQELTTAETVAQLLAGTVDVGVMALPVPSPNLTLRELVTEELLLAVPADHPLAGHGETRLSAVQDERFLLLHEAHCLSGQAEQFCARQLLEPVVTARLAQLGTALAMVRLGEGVTLVPAMATADRSPGIAYLRFMPDPPTRTVVAVTSPDRVRNPLLELFLGALHHAATCRPRPTK